jgi:O-antigen ligase
LGINRARPGPDRKTIGRLVTPPASDLPPFRRAAGAALRGATEAVVLALVVLSPWAFGAVEPIFEFLLSLGLGLALVLWGGRLLCDGRLVWKHCPVVLCLAGLFLSGVWQITPLPRPVLRAVAPATAGLYQRLLPAEGEALRADPVTDDPPGPPAGATISIYPGVTRRQLLRVLAVLLLFAVVRNNLNPEAGPRRLFLAVFLNGAVLAGFGLLQLFSTRDAAYGAIRFGPSVFGPFLYRNAYAMYVNVCIGAGLGLFLAVHGEKATTPFRGLRLAGIAAALALMLSTLAACQCRAGVLILAGTGGLFLILGRRRLPRLTPLVLAGAALVAVVALLGWSRFDLAHSRFQSIWTGKILDDARGQAWLRFLPLVKADPVWGAGLGTFPYAELPLETEPQADEGFQIWDHAHNEYLEALVEGGVVRLALTVLAVVCIYRLSYRGFVRHRGWPTAALVAGGAFGFTTLLLHSVFEFGMAFPAVVVLATVLGAALCNTADGPAYRLRLGGLAPVAAAALLAAFALTLAVEGWRSYRVQRLVSAAYRLGDPHGPADADGRIAALEPAVRLMPESVRLRLMLGDAYVERLERQWVRPDEAARDDAPLRAALHHYLRARDLCPTAAKPHFRIAVNRKYFARAEPRAAYLERAKALAPYDAELWYLCGIQEAADGRLGPAAASWRRALELTDRYLLSILRRCRGVFAASEIRERIVPERPELLAAAARFLYAAPADAAARRPFQERALALLEQRPPARDVKMLRLKGELCQALGRPDDARAAYQAAVQADPSNFDLRVEYARLLYTQSCLAEAQAEVVAILRERYHYGPAMQLQAEINQALARGRPRKE